MSSIELLTFAVQIAALFVVALSACGFLVLAHYLAPFGIPATILTKAQLLAAGLSYLITIVLSPAVSYGLAVWFATGKKQNIARIFLFIGFNISIESFILDWLFLSINGKITTGSTRFPLGFLAVITCFYAYTTTQKRIIARKLWREHTSGMKRLAQINARKPRKPTTKTLTIKRILACALVASSATYFFLLWKISHEAVIILLFLCVSGILPVALVNTFRRFTNNKALFLVAVALYFFFGIILSNLVYFETDSAWGGAGHVYAELTLEQRSGLLAPCTWPVRIVAESDSEYYVTLIPETKSALAYSIPKNKISGLHLYSLREETFTTAKPTEDKLPVSTPFESDECKHIRLDSKLVPPH